VRSIKMYAIVLRSTKVANSVTFLGRIALIHTRRLNHWAQDCVVLDDSMKKDDMKKDDNVKHDDGMKQN
jgi:hypothetical protein